MRGLREFIVVISALLIAVLILAGIVLTIGAGLALISGFTFGGCLPVAAIIFVLSVLTFERERD